jgi:hypothetical protein
MIPTIDPDCTGRGPLREVQMLGLIAKLKKLGTLNQPAPACEGRGIVIAGGGRYLSHAWAVCRHLRKLGWTEGIQVRHLGRTEMPDSARPRFAALDVELVDALEMRRSRPMRMMGGWQLKGYIMKHCRWRHIIFMDADLILNVHPEEIFSDKDVHRAGSFFMSDVGKHHPNGWGFRYCAVPQPKLEWETGFFLVDRVRSWPAICWAYWMFEHSDVWFKMFHGDKGVIHAAFLMTNCPHILNEDARWNPAFGIAHWWKGRQIVSHMMRSKRGESTWPEEFAACLDEWHEPTLNTVPA